MKITINLCTIFQGTCVLAITFIILGDKVLPKSIGNVSLNTRETIYKTVTTFIADEKEEFKRLKGADRNPKYKVKMGKPGQYFEHTLKETE
ncbi:MAG: hypothetical protein QNJ64_01140 [Crocosphaera sp.]|nr:hypothetical protein [Crocosphaera sp.]